MNDELLALIESEVLGWSGVASEPGRFDSTVYKFGRWEIGHIHTDSVADLPFPRAELISSGRAEVHRAGFSTAVSYYIRNEDDVPAAVELFRMNYDRAKSAAERRKATGRERNT